MTYQTVSLKLECQRLMQIIMRNETFHDKQQMKQHNLCQIQLSSQIQINLDHQSKAFQLFYYDPITGHHWMNNLINQLSNHNEIHPRQFVDLLLCHNNTNNEPIIKKEEGTVQFDNRERQYQFFNGIPTESLLISSLEQICKDTLLFVVRSFRGQIIHLSIHPSNSDKISILRKFSDKFPSRTLHVFIDSIDYGLGHNLQISQEGLRILSKATDLIYLKRQLNNGLTQDRDNYVRYKIFYNSLVEKYSQIQQFEYLQSVILPLVQSLLQYFFMLIRQEMPLLLNSYYNQLSLIKSVIQLNYNRCLQQYFNEINELIRFQDFIHSQIYILDQMQPNLSQGSTLHFSQILTPPQSCCYCKIHKKIKKSTHYSCSGCQKQSKFIFPLCPQCMEPFHDIKDKLKQGQIIDFATKNEKNDNIQEKKQAHQPSYKNMGKQKDSESQNRRVQKKSNDKPARVRIEGKIRKLKKNNKQKKIRCLKLQDLQNIEKLQESSERLLKMFKNLKKPKLFYKPAIEQPKNQIQFKFEMKNQLDFLKAVDIQLKREVQTFQGEAIIALQVQKQQKQKIQRQSEITKLLKIEYVEQRSNKKYMPRIEEQSQYSDQSSFQMRNALIDNQRDMNKI